MDRKEGERKQKSKEREVWARTGIEASVSVCVFGHMQRKSEGVFGWMAVNGLIF